MPDTWKAIVVAWAEATPEIDRVWLYGSRGRGDHRSDSDLDLAVEVRGHTAQERLGTAICLIGGWRAALSALIPVFVHLQDTSPGRGEEIVWPAVKREGVLLFSR